VYSKYAWVVPIKQKTAHDVTDAMEKILKEGRVPVKLQTDKGKEFLNSKFQKLLKENKIRFFTCNNPEIKCSIVERFNRTIKSRIWRYFTEKGTYKYLDTLPEVVEAYNNSYHRSIKMTPTQASRDENFNKVNKNLYGHLKLRPSPAVFKIGDFVRLNKTKKFFEKGYLPNWTQEMFKITSVSTNLLDTHYVYYY
jgi:hypothetical protein